MLRRIGYAGLLLALSAGAASAQVRSPNYDHIYCSGVYSTTAVPYDTYVVSGEDSRRNTTWSQGEYVYLNAGAAQGVKVGDEYAVLRPEKYKQKPKWFNSEPWLRRAMGWYWKDIGKLRVVVTESDRSVAQIVFSCDWLQRGDYVRPWADRATPRLKRAKFNRFAPATGRGAGMVVNAKHEGAQAGTNDVIYVNAGSNQGVKVGDYFRVFRYQGGTNETAYLNWRYAHSTWEFGKTPRAYKWDQIPREVLGEGVVLRTGENSSTVLLTYAIREVYAGDFVELEDPEPEIPEPPPAPAPALAANRSPSMSCSADRAAVMAGERVRVSARASDPDGDAINYAWRSNGGQIVGSGSAVMLDTTGLRPGRYTVTGQASDGISAASDCSVEVNVQGAAAPAQASKTNECTFRLASAGVDNVCKRILDDVALRLKNDPQARVVVIGYADPAESGAARLAAQRADNAMQYLQASGIAAARIDARAAGGQMGAGRENRRVDIVWVPAGATY